MKKLMIAAAIVCAAAFANAASCNWSTYGYDADEAFALTGGHYWLIALGTDSAAFDSIQVDNKGSLVGWTGASTYGDLADDGMAAGTLENLTEANNGTYYAMVVVDKDNGMYGKSIGLLDGISIDPPKAPDPITFDNGTSGTWGGTLANTKTVGGGGDVPEPTSAMLMLLGVAGLALKRKRA